MQAFGEPGRILERSGGLKSPSVFHLLHVHSFYLHIHDCDTVTQQLGKPPPHPDSTQADEN